MLNAEVKFSFFYKTSEALTVFKRHALVAILIAKVAFIGHALDTGLAQKRPLVIDIIHRATTLGLRIASAK